MLNKKEYILLELIKSLGGNESLELYDKLADDIIRLGDKYQETLEAEEDADESFDVIGDGEL